MDTDFYQVRWIRSGEILYFGRSLSKAAAMYGEGTCLGKGPTLQAAAQQAQAKVTQFREAEKNAQRIRGS